MSQISPLMIFSSEKEIFSWTYPLKKTLGRIKVLISPVRNKILKIWDIIFELKQMEEKCSKTYFKIVLPQEAGTFGNSIDKKPQKSHPKLKKYVRYIFVENIYSTWNPTQVVVFCKNVLIL